MKPFNLCFSILAIFSIFGAFVLGMAIHEYSHKSDVSDYVTNESGCIVEMPMHFSDLITQESGHYTFSYDPKNEEAIREIAKHTELRAYLQETLVWILWLVVFLICSREWYTKI
jgi:hypothetical protein